MPRHDFQEFEVPGELFDTISQVLTEASKGRRETTLQSHRLLMDISRAALSRMAEKLTGIEVSEFRILMLEKGAEPTAEERMALAEVLDCAESYLFPEGS